MAYSIDFRERALTLVEEGRSSSEVAKLMGISRKTISEWQKRQAQGQLAVSYPKRRGAYRINEERLIAEIEAKPDAYLSELAAVAGGSEQGVSHALKRLGITRKKRHLNTKNVIKPNARHT